MAPQPQRPDGKTFLAAVTTVAAVYVYFLIFAQFGFLEAVREELGGGVELIRPLMAMMGVAGIAGSVLGATGGAAQRRRGLLDAGFGACGLAVAAAGFPPSFAVFGIAAILVGFGVGLVTVSLAGVLRPAIGDTQLGLAIGLGTGIAYGFCNLPGIFDSNTVGKSFVAMTAVFAGIFASRALRVRFPLPPRAAGDHSAAGVSAWLVILLALVCLDSALFYFIQHTPALKDELWSGVGRQCGNAALHVAAAALAGWALDRGGLGRAVLLGATALVAAAWWIDGRHPGYAVAALIYIASVSVYSTALVFYPASSGRPAVAALVYAIAGWGGSAIGIGLAEGRADLPGFLPAGAAALLAISLVGRYFASRQGRTMNENRPA